jgi:hypothetical protein
MLQTLDKGHKRMKGERFLRTASTLREFHDCAALFHSLG